MIPDKLRCLDCGEIYPMDGPRHLCKPADSPTPSAGLAGCIAENPSVEEKYYKLLDKLLVDIDKIDGETPWSTAEPEWWLNMMALRRAAQKQVNDVCND